MYAGKQLAGYHEGIPVYVDFTTGIFSFVFKTVEYTASSWGDAVNKINELKAAPPPLPPIPTVPPYYVITYKGLKIWFDPARSVHYVPDTDISAPTLAEVKQKIDIFTYVPPTYVPPTEPVWTAEQLKLFTDSGLTSAEIAQIPPETTDVIRIHANKPKIAVWVGTDELRKRAKEEVARILAEQGESGEVTQVFARKVGGYAWWDWCDNYHVWICIRSPIGVGAVLVVAVAIAALLAWCYVSHTHYEIQKVKSESYADYSNTVESLNDLYEKGLLTYDQWQAALGNVTEAHDKAVETGKSWTDTIMEMLPMILPLLILGLVIGFMPKRKD